MLGTQRVQGFQALVRRQRFTVNRNNATFLNGNGHLLRLIRRFLWIDGPYPAIFVRRIPRAFQHAAFGGDVPGVFIAAVDLLQRCGGRDVALFQVIQQRFTGTQVPLTPRRHHFQLWRQCGVGGLETHLVVAFAGRTVAQRVGAHFQRQLDLRLGDDRPRHRRAQQVAAFVQGAGLQHRINVIADKFFTQIHHVTFRGTGLQGFLLHTFQIAALLTDVRHERHHFTAAVVLFQPWNDGRGIQAAGVRQNDFLMPWFCMIYSFLILKLSEDPGANRHAVKQSRKLIGMAPAGDIHRAAEGAGRVERRIHLHHHTIGDDALRDQLFRFCAVISAMRCPLPSRMPLTSDSRIRSAPSVAASAVAA